MRIDGFEVKEPFPALKEFHAMAVLRPWIDAGSIGTLVLYNMESLYGFNVLASLTRPIMVSGGTSNKRLQAKLRKLAIN